MSSPDIISDHHHHNRFKDSQLILIPDVVIEIDQFDL